MDKTDYFYLTVAVAPVLALLINPLYGMVALFIAMPVTAITLIFLEE